MMTSVSRESAAAIAIWIALASACGHGSRSHSVILVEQPKEKPTEATGDLQETVLSDENRAAGVLVRAICGPDTTHAAWAAVYGLRLGIRCDETCARHALLEGLKSDDVLLQALCWRRVASMKDGPSTEWKRGDQGDPVVRVMAALALAENGPLPEDLKTALALPVERPAGPARGDSVRARTAKLSLMALPFDDGPLALAVAFVEALREEAVEEGPDGAPVWAARRLREELVTAFAGDNREIAERLLTQEPATRAEHSALSARLETAIVPGSRAALRAMAMTGDQALRLEALRAMAVFVQEPEAGDFAAAAAALEHPDPALQIEGARTFLLLSLRARRD